VNLDSLCAPGAAPTLCAGFGAGLGLYGALVAPRRENSRLKSSLDSGANSVFAGKGAPADRSENAIDSTGVSLVSAFDVGQASELKLTTAYRFLETRDSLDVDGLSISITDSIQHGVSTQASQEFQLTTSFLDDRASLVSGLFLFYEDAKSENHTNNLSDTAFQGALGMPGGISATTALLSSTSRTDQRVLSYAGYSHLEFDLTDRFSMEAGLRYTYDHKIFKLLTTFRNGTVSTNARDTEHWDDWSPMVGINFHATDDMLLYAKWSRGFRGGQFNGRANGLNALTTQTVDPETVKVTEVGLKSSWMDNHLTVNLAVFRNNFTDQQLTTFTTDGARFVSLVQNAGKSRILGVEMDVAYRATNDLSLFGSIGGLNAKYLTFREPTLTGATVTAVTDVSNRDFKNTPELSFNVGAEYALPFSILSGWVTARADYSYQSQVYFDTSNTESIRQDKVGLLNGRIVWSSADDTRSIAIWGRNLLDRKYDSFGLNLSSSLGYSTSYPAAPLQAGIELTLRY